MWGVQNVKRTYRQPHPSRIGKYAGKSKHKTIGMDNYFHSLSFSMLLLFTVERTHASDSLLQTEHLGNN
jgi:hypothetical protein